MARQPEPRRGEWTPVVGLRALADLVNDALAAMGTQPVFAGPIVMRQSAIESAPTVQRKTNGRDRAARTLRPVQGGAEPPGTDAKGTDDVTEMDETHVETWHYVRLAQDGDGEAFGKLYDRYVDMVFRFIYFRVNDRALAEDFTSETFLRALRRISTISYQGRDIGAWFITIARNIVLDHLKSARHRLETPTGETIEGRERAQSTEAAVLDTLQSERLMEAVRQLGDEQRECVMLRFVQGMSVSETAAIMGKNDGAIKALQHRAVRKLADLVGSELR
jgi:RNA polymerase sigma-70 factor, ECF subfamily